MKKLFSKYLYILLLLTGVMASCSDEPMGIDPIDYDAPVVRFNVGEFPVSVTRAAMTLSEQPEDSNIENVFIAIYNDEGKIQYHTFIDGLNQSASNTYTHRILLTSGIKDLTDGFLYIIANRNSLISGMDYWDKDKLEKVKDISKDANERSLNCYWCKEKLKTLGALSATPYNLKRNFSFITVYDKDMPDARKNEHPEIVTPDNFNVTGFYFAGSPTSGYILPPDNPTAETISYDVTECPCNPNEKTNGFQLIYPIAYKDGNFYLIVEGKHTGDNDPTYYRADLKGDDGKFININPNVWYQIFITSVSETGYKTFEAAAAGTANASVKIIDTHPEVFNMITDGEYELGVSDTIRYNKDNYDVQHFLTVKVSSLDKNAGNLLVDKLAITVNDASSGWIEVDTSNPTKVSYTETSNGVASEVWQFKVNVSKPLDGSIHDGLISIVWDDRISRDVVVRLEQVLDNKLTVTMTQGSSALSNYYESVQGEVGGTKIYGISPAENCGQVRNKGFHFPMGLKTGYGSTTYASATYTCEAKGDLTIVNVANKSAFPAKAAVSSDKKSFTLTYTGGSDDLEYRVAPNALVVTYSDGSTASYDLYHTGFLYNDTTSQAYAKGSAPAAGWYYYEVVPVKSYSGTTRLWLDRNIGATASGVYIEKNGSSLFSSYQELPPNYTYSDGSRGGLYNVAESNGAGKYKMVEAVCPPGFKVPNVNEWQEVTASSQFSTPNMYDAGISYWDNRLHITGNKYSHFPRTKYINENGTKSGLDETGYYWTNTQAIGTSGTSDESGRYLQMVVFSGSSRSFETVRFTTDKAGGSTSAANNKTGLSLRCIDDAEIPVSQTNLNFSVSGYTHIFLYYMDGDTRVPINTWPGDRVTVYQDNYNNVYFDLTISTYLNIKEKFYVILNNINNNNEIVSYWNGSNVILNDTNRKNHTPFKTRGFSQQKKEEGYTYTYPGESESSNMTVYFDTYGTDWKSHTDIKLDYKDAEGKNQIEVMNPVSGMAGMYSLSIPEGSDNLIFYVPGEGSLRTGTFTAVNNHVYTPDGDTGKTYSDYKRPASYITVYWDSEGSSFGANEVPGLYQFDTNGDDTKEKKTFGMTHVSGTIYKYEQVVDGCKLVFKTNSDSWTVKYPGSGGFIAINNHVYTTSGDSSKTYAEYTGGSVTPTTYTIYWDNSVAEWSEPYAQALIGDDNNGWPGDKMNKVSSTDNIYSVALDKKYTELYFSNNTKDGVGRFDLIDGHIYSKKGDRGAYNAATYVTEKDESQSSGPKQVRIYWDNQGDNWTTPAVYLESGSVAGSNSANWAGATNMKVYSSDGWTQMYYLDVYEDQKIVFRDMSSGGQYPSGSNRWTVSENHVYTSSGDSGKTISNYTRSVTKYFTAEIYFRGGFNGWGTDNKFTWDSKNGYYITETIKLSENTDAKVADSGYSSVNMGSSGSNISGTNLDVKLNSSGGGNIGINLNGNYKFILYKSGSDYHLKAVSQ